MDGYDDLVVAVLVILAVLTVTAILVFAGAGAASGYVAGRRAPSSTGRSGAMAGLAIGAAVGVSETLLFLFFVNDATWAAILFLMMGALSAIVGPALFAYRRDLRTSRIFVLLALGVVAAPAALVGIWLEAVVNEPGGPTPPDDTLLWQYRDDSFGRLNQPPIVVDGMVHATTAACQLHALDVRTGESQWSFDIRDENGTCAMPLVEGGVLHLGEQALGAFSGELLPAGTYSPAPSATGIMVYEADWIDFREMRAIDVSSGELAWSFNPGETVPPVSVPTVSNGVVYLQLYENAYALDESTGAQIWSFPAYVGRASIVRGAPVIDAGTWYLTADTRLYAPDTATGQPLWSHDLSAPLYGPVAGEGLVMVFDGRRWSTFSSTGEHL